MLQYLQKIFGLNSVAEAQTAVALYEVKQYAGPGLQTTWYTTAVHETTHGYTFVDKQSGNAVFVSGNIKITGFTPANVPSEAEQAATDTSTTATAA
jgi:hypothetical protein